MNEHVLAIFNKVAVRELWGGYCRTIPAPGLGWRVSFVGYRPNRKYGDYGNVGGNLDEAFQWPDLGTAQAQARELAQATQEPDEYGMDDSWPGLHPMSVEAAEKWVQDTQEARAKAWVVVSAHTWDTEKRYTHPLDSKGKPRVHDNAVPRRTIPVYSERTSVEYLDSLGDMGSLGTMIHRTHELSSAFRFPTKAEATKYRDRSYTFVLRANDPALVAYSEAREVVVEEGRRQQRIAQSKAKAAKIGTKLKKALPGRMDKATFEARKRVLRRKVSPNQPLTVDTKWYDGYCAKYDVWAKAKAGLSRPHLPSKVSFRAGTGGIYVSVHWDTTDRYAYYRAWVPVENIKELR